MQQRPSLLEIASRLRASGESVVARHVAAIAGVTTQQMDYVAQAKSGKYKREKNHFAYLYPKAAKASIQAQKEILRTLVAHLRRQPQLAWLPPVSEEDGTLIVLALPAGKLVAAYKLDRAKYTSSALPTLISESTQIAVYLRKPRADVQHLAVDAASAVQEDSSQQPHED